MTVFSISWTFSDQAHFPNVDLLQTGFDEAPAGIHVVVGELLLHLGEAEAVRDQFVGIDADLVFARGSAETGNVDDVGHGFQILLDDPVFDRLQLHDVVVRIGAMEREEVDLARGTPVRAHRRHYARRQGNLGKAAPGLSRGS